MTQGIYKHKPLSEEHKKNIALSMLGKKRKPLTDEQKRHISDGRKGKGLHKGILWRKTFPLIKKSSLNHLLRTSAKWQIWRNLIFLRDNFICQNPNCEFCENKMGVFLHPHHIKPLSLCPELVFNIDNGITYCKEFHINSKSLHKGIRKGAGLLPSSL